MYIYSKIMCYIIAIKRLNMMLFTLYNFLAETGMIE